MKFYVLHNQFEDDLKKIKFYSLKDYQTEVTDFYIQNDYIDIDEVKKWKEKALTSMLAIARNRKNITKDIENFYEKSKDYTLSKFASELQRLFRLDYENKSFIGISNDDLLKNCVLNKFKDKSVKKLKSSINKQDVYYGMDDYEPVEVNNLTFYVITDENLDFKKVYTKDEILKLYHDQKMLVVDISLTKTKNKPNIGAFYEEFYNDDICFSSFPSWYAQPITTDIIKNNFQINQLMQQTINDFKAQNKRLAHYMAKSVFIVYEREKHFFEEYYIHRKQANKQIFEDKVAEATEEYKNREKKLEAEKQEIEDGKEEIKDLIDDFMEK